MPHCPVLEVVCVFRWWSVRLRLRPSLIKYLRCSVSTYAAQHCLWPDFARARFLRVSGCLGSGVCGRTLGGPVVQPSACLMFGGGGGGGYLFFPPLVVWRRVLETKGEKHPVLSLSGLRGLRFVVGI